MGGNILLAFGLTLLAGLSTGIGGAIAFFTKRTNTKFLSVALGFSAGVMIYISFMELLADAQETLITEMGSGKGMIVALVAFFGGMLFIALIDKLVPDAENPHEARRVEDMKGDEPPDWMNKKSLMRVGMFTALAVSIHNFPEGFATFMATLRDPSLGVSIAIAIAIHNIPEGIAVSLPVYYATGSRSKAFLYSFLSGLSEPAGALIGYLILMPFLSEVMFGIVFAAVAGIMVYISFDQLLPTAREYGEHHLSIYGLVAGMIVMSISLLLFG
ncbi:MAG TPA: zinc transporter ZupT [Bacillota bacterium]|nr:zinc transporter ZupT [Bacillota bacterium]